MQTEIAAAVAEMWDSDDADVRMLKTAKRDFDDATLPWRRARDSLSAAVDKRRAIDDYYELHDARYDAWKRLVDMISVVAKKRRYAFRCDAATLEEELMRRVWWPEDYVTTQSMFQPSLVRTTR